MSSRILGCVTIWARIQKANWTNLPLEVCNVDTMQNKSLNDEKQKANGLKTDPIGKYMQIIKKAWLNGVQLFADIALFVCKLNTDILDEQKNTKRKIRHLRAFVK